jgi:hypothetical protein
VRVWTFILAQPLLLPAVLPSGLLADLLPGSVVQALDVIPTVSLARLFRLACSGSVEAIEFGPRLAIVAVCTVLLLGIVAWIVRRSDR